MKIPICKFCKIEMKQFLTTNVFECSKCDHTKYVHIPKGPGFTIYNRGKSSKTFSKIKKATS